MKPGLSASYTAILDAYQKVLDHNTSGNANYKGNNRAAVINASFGPTIPSQNYPYVELNDAGNDSGTDEEMLDDMESTLVAANIMLVRSAGNGFKNSSDAFAGPLMGKVVAGTRTAGYADAASTGQSTMLMLTKIRFLLEHHLIMIDGQIFQTMVLV